MMIIIIAAVAAVVIVAVLLFMMKSKGGAPKAPKPAKAEPVKWQPEGPMKCPKCGAESPPGSGFCQGCGEKLG